jgi:hypothetical protein
MLGFTARVDLQEGLSQLVGWWRENRVELQPDAVAQP